VTPGVMYPNHAVVLLPGDRVVLYTAFADTVPQSDDTTLTVLEWGAS
jgi:hypothetical protein